ncbi:MAG: hypothetical protein KA795_04835 [Burkholderiaceae bacterium]|nr:hypothetical protein [Burkholderiaceae bacterium]
MSLPRTSPLHGTLVRGARAALLALGTAGAAVPAVLAAPVNAATVQQFVDDCALRPRENAQEVCTSYLQGAVDQIVMHSGHPDCVGAFDRPEKMEEIWSRVIEQARHPLGGKAAIWTAVRDAAWLAVPACR